jgi:hypothetical protein
MQISTHPLLKNSIGIRYIGWDIAERRKSSSLTLERLRWSIYKFPMHWRIKSIAPLTVWEMCSMTTAPAKSTNSLWWVEIDSTGFHVNVSMDVRNSTQEDADRYCIVLVTKHCWDEMAGHLACIHNFCRKIRPEETNCKMRMRFQMGG